MPVRRDAHRSDQLRARLHVAAALHAPACGMEADEAVWSQTDANLRIIGAPPASVRRGDWLSYFR